MSSLPAIQRVPLTVQIRMLLCDFEIDVAGERSGLTSFELGRAWRARYGTEMSRSMFYRLSESLLIEQLPTRRCAVTGGHFHPWVPVQ
jgi:hypothetical protein